MPGLDVSAARRIVAEEGGGKVVPLDAGVREVAEAYASWTGRELSLFPPVLESGVLEGAVLVGFERHIDAQLLRRVYATVQTNAPGLLVAQTIEELWSSAMANIEALTVEEPEIERAVFIADEGVALLEDASSTWEHPLTDASDVRQVLTQGAGVLAIVTHSDGIDAFLAPGVTLCSLAGDVGNRFEGHNRCQRTRECHAHAQSVDTALKSGNLIDPTDISARFLIFGSCWGYLPIDGRRPDQPLNLGMRFAQNRKIGAALLPWRVSTVRTIDIEWLCDLVVAGASAGRVLARLHRDPPGYLIGGGYCLVGDPATRLRVPGSSTPGPPPPQLAERVERRRGAPRDTKRMFVRACLEGIASQNPDSAPRAAPADRPMAQLCDDLNDDRPTLEQDRSLQAEILRAMAKQFMPPYRGWLSYARTSVDAKASEAKCPSCGRTHGDLLVMRCEIPSLDIERTLADCAYCGIVCDVPGRRSIGIETSESGAVKVALRGRFSRGDWIGCLMVRSQARSDVRVWEWPCPDRKPARTLVPEAVWPPGTVDVGIYLAKNFELWFAGRRFVSF